MCFDTWCAQRADHVRRSLTTLMYALHRVRIVREQRADAARAYEEIEASLPRTTKRRMCVNHPTRWAQDGPHCRMCARAYGTAPLPHVLGESTT